MNHAGQDNYRFEYQDEPIPEDEQVLFDGLNNEVAQKKNVDPIKPIRIYIKDAQGMVLGGASGVSFYGSLYIDMLWLKENMRHQGLGKKLLMEAERIGRERNCTFATLNTMDWEALRFYQKLGYAIEFVREGYDKESKMYMLRKKL